MWRYYIDKAGEKVKRRSFKLPQVIPIVLYDGEGRWTVQRDIIEKVRKVAGYEKHVPRYEYMIIDLSEIDRTWLTDFENVLSKLLIIDNLEKDEIKEILKEVIRKIKDLPEGKKEKLHEYLHVMMVGVEVE